MGLTRANGGESAWLRLSAGWQKRLEGFKAMQARNFPGNLVTTKILWRYAGNDGEGLSGAFVLSDGFK